MKFWIQEKWQYNRSGRAPPAACVRYLVRKLPHGVFSALILMLGWRFMNARSKATWRGQNEASQACATLIVTGDFGSGTFVLGQPGPVPAASTERRSTSARMALRAVVLRPSLAPILRISRRLMFRSVSS